MNRSRRLSLQIALAMGSASLLSQALKVPAPEPEEHEQAMLSGIIPRVFGEWTIDEGSHSLVRAASRRARIYNTYDQLLELTFMNRNGYRVMLAVASSQGLEGMQVHRPEVCYSANGYQIDGLESSNLSLAGRSVPVRHLRAERPGRKEPVTYWTVVAGTPATEFDKPGAGFGTWDFRWRRIEMALRRELIVGILVRLSSIDPDPSRAYLMQAQFADAMVRTMSRDQRRRILGVEIGG